MQSASPLVWRRRATGAGLRFLLPSSPGQFGRCRQHIDGLLPARREVAATCVAATAKERIEAHASVGHCVGSEELKLGLLGLCLPESERRTRFRFRALLLRVRPRLVVLGPFALADLRVDLCTSDPHQLVEQVIERRRTTDHLQRLVSPRDPRARPSSRQHPQEAERREVIAEAIGRQTGQRQHGKPKFSGHRALLPSAGSCSG